MQTSLVRPLGRPQVVAADPTPAILAPFALWRLQRVLQSAEPPQRRPLLADLNGGQCEIKRTDSIHLVVKTYVK